MNTNQLPYDQNHPEYVSFFQAYIGHLTLQLIVYGIATFLCWIASFFIDDLQFKIQAMVLMAIVIAAIGEGLVTALERPAIVRAKHGDPGGLSYAWPQVVVPPIMAILGCFISFDNFSATVFSIIFVVTLFAVTLFTTPWKPGVTRQDIQKNWDTVKDKYKEAYLEERYKGVNVDPEIKKLFDRKNDL